MQKICFSSAVFLTLLTGCSGGFDSEKKREKNSPNIVSGQVYMEQGEYDKAIAAFKKAIEKEPPSAQPHLDLAVIYQQHQINPIYAIYHYDRYLELRPETEKAAFLKEQRRKMEQALADKIIGNFPEVRQAVEERDRLFQQNSELKRQIALARQSSSSAPQKHASSEEIAPAADQHAARRIYHVRGKDTLSKIAEKFYGDSEKWHLLFDANKDVLNNPNNLRTGQSIIIPADGNGYAANFPKDESP